MPFKTRLAVVVRLRERTEDLAKVGLGRARQVTGQAEQALDQAKAEALPDGRRAGSAADWQVAEAARVRAIAVVKRAEEALLQAKKAEEVARKAFEGAHRQAEAVRRAADGKRAEMAHEADRAERKQYDELAAIQFGRRR